MIGNIVTDENGIPLDNNGVSLKPSTYNPPQKIQELFARCQNDYQQTWRLQHRSFDEFDGLSLLGRVKVDQQTFGAFVGVQYVAKSKQWRWRGRKNTARNKIVGILAYLISAILIPTVYATDDQQHDDKEAAKAMRILLEEHLRKADYEIKFMYMVLSALVHPAVFVQVEFVEALQRVKRDLGNGKIDVVLAVDDILSGLNLNIVPIDELMLGDFFTFGIQRQPYLVRIRRITYDEARGRYAGKYFDKDAEGKMCDRFDYVRAGTTRVFMASNEGATLFDVEWTEADQNMVQEATFYYRGEDLEVKFVGGVFMGKYDPEDPNSIYNINPFKHRRMTLVGTEWYSMPVYPFAMSGFEPLDPNMRFAYFKSAAFKEYWDDATLNMAHALAVDAAHLDTIKPLLISGIAKYDQSVIAPGAVASLPKEATVAPYSLSPNHAAIIGILTKQEEDMADSTIAKILEGQIGSGRISAFAFQTMIQNAKKMLGVFGALVGDLVKQVGDLSVDEIVMNTTVGELNEEIPGKLGMEYKTILARGRERGRDVTHKIVLTDRYIGKPMTDEERLQREWELWESAGGTKKDATRIWEINPYQFARKCYRSFVDVDELVQRSTAGDRQRGLVGFNLLTDPRVAPYTDPEAVVNDFIIDEYGGNDPERYKRKGNSANTMMNGMGMPGAPDTGPGARDTLDGSGLSVGRTAPQHTGSTPL